MASTMRWRYGDTSPVLRAVRRDDQIEIGDLVWADGREARPASAMPALESLDATQLEFRKCFVGVAMQHSRPGDTHEIRIATSGVFEFDCERAAFATGCRIGIAKPAGRAAPLNQNVVYVSPDSEERSIGYCAKLVHEPGTSVLVDIVSLVKD